MKKTFLYIYIVSIGILLPLSALAYTFNQSLTIGSEGQDVSELQTILIAEGYLAMPAGVSLGYFGSLTQNALIQYQSAHGISPAFGYFGPLTRAYININTPLAAKLPTEAVPSRGDSNTLTQEFIFGKEIRTADSNAPYITSVSPGDVNITDRITVYGDNLGSKVTIYSSLGILENKKVTNNSVSFNLYEIVGDIAEISRMPVSFSVGNSNGISSNYGYIVIK